MEYNWIPRDEVHPDLPKESYTDVIVNLQTPTHLESAVMTYFPPILDDDGNVIEKHTIGRNNPQSWDNNFTHYCLLPNPIVREHSLDHLKSNPKYEKKVLYLTNYIKEVCDHLTSGNYMHHKGGLYKAAEMLETELEKLKNGTTD